jgi:ABC-type amino acid transport system permease subunit
MKQALIAVFIVFGIVYWILSILIMQYTNMGEDES